MAGEQPEGGRRRPTAVEALQITGLCIAAAVRYGILHDQVTARICVEYFIIGHPPLFDTTSPNCWPSAGA